MAKIDYEKLAAEIIGKVGGTENIHTVSHCATRLRFVLKDRSLANEKELRQLQGVLGSVDGSGQFQVILGENLFPVYDAILKNYNLDEGEEVQENHVEDLELKNSDEKKNMKYYFDKCIQFMSASLTPFITVLYGAGMLRVVLSLISYFNADESAYTTYQLFNFVSQAPFYFMPILIAYGESRVLK